MYELVKVTDKTFYIESPAKIGMCLISQNEVIFIDSGNGKEAGRKARQILDKNSFTLKAIYNTHGHADHAGGNKYLKSRTGCEIYAPGIECDFVNHPLLEPSYLWGGYPIKELKNKFLMAEESECLPLKEGDLPEGFSSIPLPGHFFSMTGYATPDGCVFLADCLAGEETFTKYKIPFLYDVESYLETLENVKAMDAFMFIPSHAKVTDNIAPLAQYNIDKTYETAEKIAGICKIPKTFEKILKEVFETFDMEMTFEQYAMTGSTVKSFLSYLKDKGEVKAYIEDNELLYSR